MDKYQSWKPTDDNSNKKISNETQTEGLPGKLPLNNTKDSQYFDDVPFDSRSRMTNKEIITELAPEKFSLKDVELLQKLNRDLRAENLKKTMAYIKLQQDYQLMKDEKGEDEIRRQETCSLLKKALDEISSHYKCSSQYPEPNVDTLADQRGRQLNPADLAEREKMLKELSDLTRKYNNLQRREEQGRRQVAVYEEKYQYFRNVVNKSAVVLNELKQKFDDSIEENKILKSEVAIWKNKSREYKKGNGN